MGFTIIELLVVVTIIALLIALLVPAIGKARDSAMVTQSQGNLKNLQAACGSYGAAWNDRQWTIAADDIGLYGNGCYADYVGTNGPGGCPASPILGYGCVVPGNTNCGLYAYWLPCGSTTGTPGNWLVLHPFFFGGPCAAAASAGFGSWRMANVKNFNDYVGGRFYDRAFYAPKDKVTLSRAEPAFERGDEFSVLSELEDGIVYSSYVFSPAAMWNPDVLSGRKGFTAPGPTLPAAWRSPSVGQAAFPDLKTRMLEHNWLQNQQGGEFNGNFSSQEPWYFNQGYNSSPVTLFFDGHIAVTGASQAMDADAQVLAANQDGGSTAVEKGLWVRQIPVGPWNSYQGYYTNYSYDTQIKTSYHVFTTDGILGRDFVTSP